jgi:hypothetical protein
MVAGLETHLTLMKFIIALLDVEVKLVVPPAPIPSHMAPQ